ncbi:MAG: molybdenum cofactor biosynthesis protein MoaD [Alphaproteobacteria bacterium]|jgi:molybdopterin synthase sulfur carrier subunit|nr:molybdenum cofactor biosynthesis protein MoaD [Alphaproteobacteria bacterium]
MEVQYLSWLRTRAGKSKEEIDPPETVRTLQDLVDWLSESAPSYKTLFSYRAVIAVSVNGELAQNWEDVTVRNTDKISFFSPLAGG